MVNEAEFGRVVDSGKLRSPCAALVFLARCLDSGISVVAITYRYSTQAIVPASFHDSARAVQYVRHHAKERNIDRLSSYR